MNGKFSLCQKLGLCWRILRQAPDNLLAHADRELPQIPGDVMQALMNQQLRELILVFGTQGHSELSASYARGVLGKLLDFQPLGPLLGTDSEWEKVEPFWVSDDMAYQNLRCSEVFKRLDGSAYHAGAIVYRDPEGFCYTDSTSNVDITFPYTPTTVFRDVPADEPVIL